MFITVTGRNELEVRTQLALNKALEARAPPTPRTPASRAVSQQHMNDDQVITGHNVITEIIVAIDTGVIVSNITN